MMPKQLCAYNPNCRRDPTQVYYKPDMRLLDERCLKGSKCTAGHTHHKHEVFYHPLNYKTRPCVNGVNCQWNANCAFLHSNAKGSGSGGKKQPQMSAEDEKELTIIKFWSEWRSRHGEAWDSQESWQKWKVSADRFQTSAPAVPAVPTNSKNNAVAKASLTPSAQAVVPRSAKTPVRVTAVTNPSAVISSIPTPIDVIGPVRRSPIRLDEVITASVKATQGKNKKGPANGYQAAAEAALLASLVGDSDAVGCEDLRAFQEDERPQTSPQMADSTTSTAVGASLSSASPMVAKSWADCFKSQPDVFAKPNWRTYSVNDPSRLGVILGTDNPTEAIGSSGTLRIFPQEVLGYGNHSVVFRGFHRDLGEVAIKRMDRNHSRSQNRPESINGEVFCAVERELQALADCVDYCNVVTLRGFDQTAEFDYIAMELCDCSLQDALGVDDGTCPKAAPYRRLLTQNSPLSVSPFSMDVLRGICDGLQFIHSLRYIHGDIKPSNILLQRHPTRSHSSQPSILAKITDFGMSDKLFDPGKKHGRCEAVRASSSLSQALQPAEDRAEMELGSFGWMAPELVKGCSKSQFADIYSLGCVLCYLLSNGYHPFFKEGDSWLDVAVRMANGQHGRLPWVRQVSPDGAHLALQMLSLEPSDRPLVPKCLLHPLFWSKDRKVRFLQDLGEYLGEERLAPPLPGSPVDETHGKVLNALESTETKRILFGDDECFPVGLDTDWRSIVQFHFPELYELMVGFTYYNEKIRFLVRFLRNTVSHRRSIHNALCHQGVASSSTLNGSNPRRVVAMTTLQSDDGTVVQDAGVFVHRLMDLFPMLVIACLSVVSQLCPNDFVFKTYFTLENS